MVHKFVLKTSSKSSMFIGQQKALCQSVLQEYYIFFWWP